jgi:hypothetical protein
MNKYEQLIEYIINDDEAKAKALFHDIVVGKSREIYESLMDEEDQEQQGQLGGNPVNDLTDEVNADEQGMAEEEDDMDDMGDDEIGTDDSEDGGDFGGDDEMGMGSEEGEGDIEDRVMDLEAALDELKAEFDSMMGGEGGDDDMGGDDMGDEMGAMGGNEMGMDMGAPEDEGMYMEGDNPFAKSGSGKSGSGKSASGSGSGSGKKSAAESIREYVEKVSDGHGAEKGGQGEGHEVGKGGSTSVNKQSLVAGKNDMGGTSANIAKGGSEQAPDGTSPKGKTSGFVKSASEVDVAKRNVNKPGGNKGAQNWYSDKAKTKSAEGSTTDGSYSVNKQSLEPGRK